jgi:hypothetical protein
MLSVYTRHSQKCPHRDDIAWRRCRCPKWIQDTPSEDHEFLRTSAQTRTWEQAEETALKLREQRTTVLMLDFPFQPQLAICNCGVPLQVPFPTGLDF